MQYILTQEHKITEQEDLAQNIPQNTTSRSVLYFAKQASKIRNLKQESISLDVIYFSYQLHHRTMAYHQIVHICSYPPQKRSFVCYLLPTVILTVLLRESILIFSHNIHCRKYQCNENCKAAYQCKDHNASLLGLKEIKIKKVLTEWAHSSQWLETLKLLNKNVETFEDLTAIAVNMKRTSGWKYPQSHPWDYHLEM